MKNKMVEVAKLWNLELWETFKLEGFYNDYVFSLNGLMKYDNGFWEETCPELLNEILVGKTKIVKYQYLPSETDTYYSINLSDESNRIVEKIWDNTQANYLDYYIGNCFKCKEDISTEVKTELLQRIAKSYWQAFDEGIQKKTSPLKQKSSV